MKFNKIIFGVLIISIPVTLSCKKLIEVDPPKDGILTKNIFESDDIATSAVTGIYNRMINTGYASGNSQSVTSACGHSSDELINNGGLLNEFFENKLSENSTTIRSLWGTPYQHIYVANSVLEQLSNANGLTPSLRDQLKGEAYFIRAFSYFYLTNMFGPIPLHISTDYRVNSTALRIPVAKVYEQIILDLKIAEGLLTDKYVTTERVRPNLAAVQGLLARTYLYMDDWINAEKYSTLVINKTNLYGLETLENVFLKNSKEAIWQLMPNPNTFTNEGNYFILVNTPTNGSLRPSFVVNGFESGDNRKTSWIRSFTNSTGTYYYPFKYKVRLASTLTEYSMVLRLGEQFLIRSEARAKQDNMTGAINDVDIIRKRAGLRLIKDINPGIGKSDLLNAIQKERFTELFSEWGHRWFDLKRTRNADAVLKSLKSDWQATDQLYPIHISETRNNPNIYQNDGY